MTHNTWWLVPCLALAVACGGDEADTMDSDAGASDCEGDCIVAPAPACDGDDRISFASLGTCVSGECQFEELSRESCEFGCADSTCLPDPCDGVRCNRPPPASCDGDIAITWDRFGACTDGQCSYERFRTDCASAGDVCVDGACVAVDPCEGVVCDTPPANTCDAGSVRTWASAGVCADGRCSYSSELVACGADEVCQDGVCVGDPACDGVVCDEPPASFCRAGDAVAYDADGRCLGGTCVYDETVTACAASDLECSDGACRRNPCRDVVCSRPPRPLCDGQVQVRYASVGSCSEGTCSYGETRTDCTTLNQRCVSGTCVDACDGVSCESPPADDCDGDVARVWAPSGVCVVGACEYDATTTDCGDLGLLCRAGSCFSACDDVTCNEPPVPVCETATSIRRWTAVPCADGACDYGPGRVELCGPGDACSEGVCAPIACVDPAECTPEPRCDGDVLVSYVGTADCVDALCEGSLAEVRNDCAATGGTCVAGTCVADPCDGVVCDDAPAAFCDGADAVRFDAVGVCEDGTCVWSESRETCSGTCWLGACYAGALCDGVFCDEPPPAFCDDGTAVSYAPGGTCDDGVCTWTERRDDCTALGEFCDDGACVAVDPCAVVTCGAAPDPRCDGTVAVTPGEPGTCADGVCAWDETRVDCAADGSWCAAGVCVADDPCDPLTCDDAPAPRCDGNTLVTSVDGSCVDGACAWDELRLPCGLEGARCLDGACVPVADVCDTLDCSDVPAPTCADETTAIVYLGAGVCDPDRARCDLSSVESVVPCSAGESCLDGVCRRLAGAGEVVVTELFVTGNTGAPSDVWIEVEVVAAENVDLAGLTLRDASGNAWTLAASFEAAPGDRVVFGGGVASPPSGPDVVFDALTLRLEREDQLVLSVGAIEVDRVVYGGDAWPAATNRATGLTVPPDADANDDPDAWCVADDVYDAVTDRRGTPGSDELTCAPAACDDASCTNPPPDVCENLLSVRSYDRGACDDAGLCEYDSTAEIIPCDVEAGEQCVDGACVLAACTTPTDCLLEPFCFAGSAFRPDGAVPCVDGACAWTDAIVIDACEARGAACVDGACVEP